MIVDDDNYVVRGLTRLIATRGFVVQSFLSAEELLSSHFDHSVPHCFLLDLRMPGLDGLDLQEQLLTLEPDAAIVFLSGYGDVPSTVRAMRAGAVDFLTKPVGEDMLFDAIDRAFDYATRRHAGRPRR